LALASVLAGLSFLALLVAVQGARLSSDAIPGTALAPPPGVEARALDAYKNSGLSFVANRGQTDARVRYYAAGPGYAFRFMPDKVVLSLGGRKRAVSLHLAPIGANPRARLEAGERAPGTVNYLVGSDRQTGVPAYREVAYRELWPGIDMVFKGEGGRLKYEFHMRPGADPSRIRLAYRGATRLRTGRRGNLLIGTAAGTLRDSRPRSFQSAAGKRTPVESHYVLEEGGNAYGFGLGPGYDADRALVIDPGLVYSTFISGLSDDDFGYALAIDASGSAYVTGRSYSPDYPTTPGAFDTANASADAFVSKLDPSGSALDYSTYLGGSGSEVGYGIAVDSSGSAYVTGHTASADFPVTPGALDTTLGYSDGFVLKLAPAGDAVIYGTYLGGALYDEARAIAVDETGNAYVTGYAASADFPTTAGAFDTTRNGGADVFVSKLDTTGSALLYSTLLGGTGAGQETGTGIAVKDGRAYVAGYTPSSNFPITAGAADTNFGGALEGFVSKLDPSGSALDYSTFLGGASDDSSWGLALDASANAYVTGSTKSSDFPTTADALDSGLDGSDDAFVSKIVADGSAFAYSTYLGGSSADGGFAIAVDPDGGAEVGGVTFSTDFPTTAGAFDTSFNGSTTRDAFVARLDAAGSSLPYSTYLGGIYGDEVRGVANDAAGDTYVAGWTQSPDFPTTPGSYDPNGDPTNRADVFVTKLGTSSSPGYPRPKGASPLRVSLVPAFKECTDANTTHGAPLESPACGPPVQESGHLTIGTPDAPSNSKSANSIGSLFLRSVPGNASTVADEADVSVTASITDVRNANDLSDYTGSLRISLALQVTDRSNGPTKSDPATGSTRFDVAVPCTATTGTEDIGSTCSVVTSADAVVPGAIKESVRTIWQTDQVQVWDGGADGDVETAPDTVFARQGVFVP
jgi:hypothetical protein